MEYHKKGDKREMKRLTKWVLRLTILTVGICVPYIVIVNIIRGASYWTLGYLVWGVGIILAAGYLREMGDNRNEKLK